MKEKTRQAIHDHIFTRKLDAEYIEMEYMHKCAAAVVHLNFCKWRQFGNYEIIGIPCISSIITGLNFYFDPFIPCYYCFQCYLYEWESVGERVGCKCVCVCSFVTTFSEKCRLQRFWMLFLIWYNSKLWSRMTFCTLSLNKLLFLSWLTYFLIFFQCLFIYLCFFSLSIIFYIFLTELPLNM